MSHTRSILIIEDDSDMAEVLKLSLELEEFQVFVATDGRQALDLLQTIETPGVIFMDLHMRGMDGVQFRSIQEKDPKLAAIHVVIMSASSDMAAIIPPSPTISYLRKPYSLDDVLKIANRHSARA